MHAGRAAERRRRRCPSRRRARAAGDSALACRAFASAFSTNVACGSVGLGDAQLALRDHVDAERLEQPAELAELARVARREHEALDHRGAAPAAGFARASRWAATRSAMPPRASSSRRRTPRARTARPRPCPGPRRSRPRRSSRRSCRCRRPSPRRSRGRAAARRRRCRPTRPRRGRAAAAAGRRPRRERRDRVGDRDPGAGDRRAARAAVGLQHVAVDADRALAERRRGSRPRASSGRSAAGSRACGPTACRRPPRAASRVCVERGSIPYSAVSQPFPRALQERRHALLDARGAQHARVAGAHQHRAFGVARPAALEHERSQLVGSALVRSHRGSLRKAGSAPS